MKSEYLEIPSKYKALSRTGMLSLKPYLVVIYTYCRPCNFEVEVESFVV